MKRFFVTSAALVFCAQAASAFPIFAGHLRVYDSYGSTGGGEFRVEPEADFSFVPAATGTPFQFGNAAAAPKFESFCVEYFEDLYYGVSYNADLNTQTRGQNLEYSGGAHGGFDDPLDPRTAYLYHNFINHTLVTPYDYVNEGPRIDDANALQTAIWFIEEEISTPLLGKALDLYNEANAAVNSGAWVGLGDVRVLNLYTNDPRAEAQNILVMVPAPGGAAGLLGLMLAARRRRRID